MEIIGKDSIVEKLKRINRALRLGFDLYGTKIGFLADNEKLLEKIQGVFPHNSIKIKYSEVFDYFLLVTEQSAGLNGFYWVENGIPELAFKFERLEDLIWENLEQKILLTLAMISPPRMFYFHAGAVSFNGEGIIIPGKTFSGKTTLTREFIKRGAVYYSDDCAVIDSRGLLYPYPVKLGVRQDDFREYLDAGVFGAEIGLEPVKVKFILLTQYEKNGRWNPRSENSGQTVFQLLKHLFFPASINRKPSETIEFATDLIKKSRILQSPRGEAGKVVDWFEDQLEVGSLKKV